MTVETAMRPLYLEDLAKGQKFHTGSVSVTADAIKAFAAEFDPQPFHLDEAAAAKSLFGGLAASGWHTAAITMRLFVDGDLRLAGGIVGAGLDEMRWTKPVYPGDALTLETEVLEMRPSKSRLDQGLIKVRNTVLNQRREPALVQVVNLLVQRRPAE
jgi:acyl dehydratase